MTATRTALPSEVMRITPGYSWRVDLDIKFDGARPTDWPEWVVRMHVWGDGVAFSLRPGSGVTFEPVDIPGSGPVVMPVIRMSAIQTETLRDVTAISYLIDVQAPGEDPEDYFAGAMMRLPAPPRGLIT